MMPPGQTHHRDQVARVATRRPYRPSPGWRKMNRLKMGFTTAIICASIFLVGSIAWGQGIITGNLAGTMQDATGAVVPGAKITVTRPDTNAVFTATSGANGNFSLNDLPV